VKLKQTAGFANLLHGNDLPHANFRIIFLLILTFLCAENVGASSMAPRALSIAELTTRSDVVALGTVSSVASDWNLDRTAIETRIDLKVEEILKGTVDQAKISFYQLGGAVGGTASSLGEAAAFVEGERVALFLFKNDRERLQLVGFFQGKFSVERRPKGETAVRRIPGVSKPVDEFPLDNFKLQVQKSIA
jgi:hypothetical protein